MFEDSPRVRWPVEEKGDEGVPQGTIWGPLKLKDEAHSWVTCSGAGLPTLIEVTRSDMFPLNHRPYKRIGLGLHDVTCWFVDGCFEAVSLVFWPSPFSFFGARAEVILTRR